MLLLPLTVFVVGLGLGESTALASGSPCHVTFVETDLSTEKQLKVDCSSRLLDKIPEHLPETTEILDLRNNNLTKINLTPFVNITYLDLSNNQLYVLDKDIFQGLHNLRVLNIAGNNLCLPHGYPEGVFRDLTSLEVLKTYSNNCVNGHKRVPDKVIGDLVALQKLSLDATHEFVLGQGFQNLTRLERLEISSYADCDSYHIIVAETSFSNLTNSPVSELTLRGCAFRGIEPTSLRVFRNLTSLNMACTRHLDIQSLFAAIYHLEDYTLLETLIIDGMEAFSPFSRPKTKGFMKNTKEIFCHPKLRNLKRLSLRGNRLYHGLQLQKDGEPCLPQLHHINLGMNLLFDIVYYTGSDYQAARKYLRDGVPASWFWSLSNVRTVDISHLFDQVFVTEYEFCKGVNQEADDYFRKVPKSVANVPDLANFNVTSGVIKSQGIENRTDLSTFKGVLHSMAISPGTQVLFADAFTPGKMINPLVSSQCPFVLYPLDTLSYFNVSNNAIGALNCSLLGLRKLKVFDASNCQISQISLQPDVHSLEKLYIGGNKLNNANDFIQIFDNMASLKELDLSKNNIHTLPPKSFVKLKKLEKLDLSGNRLGAVNLFLHDSKLRILDLSFNVLELLTKPFLNHLESLSKLNAGFRVFLYGNPISCECNSIHFIKWLQNTNVTIEKLNSLTCVNSTKLLVDIDIRAKEKSCEISYLRYYAIIGSLCFVMIVVIISSVSAYRQRWKIAWHIYTWNSKRQNKEAELLSYVDDVPCDAYIEYYRDDDVGLPWLKNVLLQWVEKDWGKKLFVFDRDSVAGNSIIGETISGIQQSRMVLFILTNVYLKHGHWEMVLYWAVRQGLDKVIICCLEDMSVDKMPKSLAKVAIELQEKYPTHYLKFPLAPDRDSNSNMRNGLKSALEEQHVAVQI